LIAAHYNSKPELMPPQPQVICSGCGDGFAYRAFSLHLAQTRNPPCRAIYEKQKAYIPGANANDDNGPPEPAAAHDSFRSNSQPGSPNQFSGDYFGTDYDYDDDEYADWDDHDDDLIQESDSSSEESDWDELDPNTELEWDLPPAPPNQPEPRVSTPSEDDDDPMDDERGRSLTEEEKLRDAANGLYLKPFVVKFPSARAGEILHDDGHSAYRDYEQELGPNAAENLYEPFAHALDWEFAQWSKLRGPSSTSASELMNIDGVCSLVLNLILIHS
jgi:hypothetical protein